MGAGTAARIGGGGVQGGNQGGQGESEYGAVVKSLHGGVLRKSVQRWGSPPGFRFKVGYLAFGLGFIVCRPAADFCEQIPSVQVKYSHKPRLMEY
jgi:hypothetical protein